MKCNRCGRDIEEDESFCIYCGNDLKELKEKKKKKEKEKIKIEKKKEAEEEDEVDNKTIIETIMIGLFVMPVFIGSIIGIFKSIALMNNHSTGDFERLTASFGCFIYIPVAIITFVMPIAIYNIGKSNYKLEKEKEKEEQKNKKSR